MAEIQVVLTALLSADNDRRNQAEVLPVGGKAGGGRRVGGRERGKIGLRRVASYMYFMYLLWYCRTWFHCEGMGVFVCGLS